MIFFKPSASLRALAFLALLAAAPAAQASTLFVDRGLPNINLNNAAGENRSNVVLAFQPPFQTGDTFSLPSTGNPSLPSWRIDKLSTWFVFGRPENFGPISPGEPTPPKISDAFSQISLFLGPDAGVGSSIDRVVSSSISGNEAEATNVAITPVTYEGGLNFEASGGGELQIWQVHFTDLGTFSAGDYAFSVAGLPNPNLPEASRSNLFNHASNAILGGFPADGADDLFAFFTGSADDLSLAFSRAFGTGVDINVQVHATAVPLPAALPLLLAALGGLGLAARRRRKAA